MLFLIVCWAVLALGLFLMRPRSLRTQDDSKPSDRQVKTASNYFVKIFLSQIVFVGTWLQPS